MSPAPDPRVEIISRHKYRASPTEEFKEQIVTLFVDYENLQARLVETTEGVETNRIELSLLAVSALTEALNKIDEHE